MAGEVLQLDDAGNLVLNSAGEMATGCPEAAPSEVCWYRLKKCTDGTDANLWLSGALFGLAPAPGSGDCPPMPERHVYDVEDPTCYYVPAGAAGATTTPPAVLPGAALEIADCESCGTAGFPCSCVVDGQTCRIVRVDVAIAGTTIVPVCCSAGLDLKHTQCNDQGLFNASYRLLKHNGHGYFGGSPAGHNIKPNSQVVSPAIQQLLKHGPPHKPN
jgi:hypothetical protein